MRFVRLFVFLFLLFPCSGKAQSILNPNSGSTPLPDSSAEALTKYFRGKYLFSIETIPFFISSQTEFDTLLDAATKTKIAPIDFSKYDLRGSKSCAKCIALCPDPKRPCHRSACNYELAWLISPKPGINIASQSFEGNQCENFFGAESFLVIENDSAYKSFLEKCSVSGKTESPDFSKFVLLVRAETQDCNAQFVSEFFQDSATKTITWRLRSRYGGCRGMKTTVHQMLVPKIAGYTYRTE